MSGSNKKKFPKKLLAYLEKNKIDPKVLEHRTVYTAIDVANTLKRKVDEIVKSLLVKADDYYYIVCLPADHNLDFKKIKESIEKIAGNGILPTRGIFQAEANPSVSSDIVLHNEDRRSCCSLSAPEAYSV